MKGHRPEITADYLALVADIQLDLAARDYPSPRPLTGPIASGPGHVAAETMLEHHRPHDPYAPDVRDALAAGLAELVACRASRTATRSRATGHAMDVTPGALYPVPHSARFDFAATAAGAAWIDDLARTARARAANEPTHDDVVHGDWRIQNVGVHEGAIDAVFDWDSVTVADEMTALGVAALTFGVDWDRATTRFPTSKETAAFVGSYATARRACARRLRVRPARDRDGGGTHLRRALRARGSGQYPDGPARPTGPARRATARRRPRRARSELMRRLRPRRSVDGGRPTAPPPRAATRAGTARPPDRTRRSAAPRSAGRRRSCRAARRSPADR